MKIWIIKDGEPLPMFDSLARMMRAANLSEYLAKMGHHVTWWTSTWSHYQRKKYVEKDHSYFVNPNFEIKMLDSFGYKKNISFKRLFHYVKIARKFSKQAEEMEKPDLIISALPAVELSYAATQYASKKSCPILIDCRDRWPDIMVEIFPKILRPLARIGTHYQFSMMKSLCKNASGFIGISEPFLSWATKYAGREVNENDIFLPLVSPNFSHITANDEVNASFFKDKFVDFEGKFTVVFAGNYKNTVDLTPVINAFKCLPLHCQLLIAGSASGNESIEKKYRILTKDLRNVRLLGWLNTQQLDYLYRHAHVALVPYTNADFFSMNLTNKPIEYLYYGLPILTSVKGYLSDLLTKYRVGFHYNNESLADLIRTLDANRELLQNIKIACKQLYTEKFDYEKVMSDFMCFLKERFKIG